MGRQRLTRADRPVPGRRPLDGSRMLARLMRAGKVDGRTKPAKAREAIVAVLAGDWGGLEAMPGAARLLVDRIAVLTVRLMMREQRLMAEAAQGIDDPTSDKHTIALHNGFTRALARLEEMRAREGQRGDRTPSLEEYLAAAAARASGNGAAATPTGAGNADYAEPPAPPADAVEQPSCGEGPTTE